jgi:DNA-binding NarL/FixJ family response regulator
MIRVVIADDQHLIRRAIRLLIENEGDIEVVGEAANGYEAVEFTKEMNPDVLVLDINMPDLDGIEATRRIKEMSLPTHVLILSMYSDEYNVRRALRSGAKGYALKSSVPQELLAAIRDLSQDMVFISPLANGGAGWSDESNDSQSIKDDPIEMLTNREREVFKLIAEGNANSQIAHRLGISIKTVEKHRQNLMNKLGVHDTASLVRKAILHKMIFVDS